MLQCKQPKLFCLPHSIVNYIPSKLSHGPVHQAVSEGSVAISPMSPLFLLLEPESTQLRSERDCGNTRWSSQCGKLYLIFFPPPFPLPHPNTKSGPCRVTCNKAKATVKEIISAASVISLERWLLSIHLRLHLCWSGFVFCMNLSIS